MSLISFVSSAPATSQSANSAASLADNFDSFLTILTAQIQNQDPLEPLDSTQFTQQLVQFSGVEQQIRSNQYLEGLISATRSTVGASLSGYLGQRAEIASTAAAYSGEPVEWRYSLPADAKGVTLTILDASGKPVASRTGETGAGEHDFIWDGRNAAGKDAPPGAYSLLIEAKTAAGETLKPEISVLASITGVDLTHGEPALATSAGIYSYSDIRRLMRQ